VLVRHGKAVELAETEPGEMFQRIGHRRAGDEGVLLPRADESIAASLPKVQDEKTMKGKLPLVQGRSHLRPRNRKRRANRRR
jgi:hypothetical protein